MEMETTMKKMLLATAILLIASPALAQSYTPGLSGNMDGYTQKGPQSVYQGAQAAFARVLPGRQASPTPYAVYDSQGKVIGADPDANVRLQLRKDHDEIQ
jgi:hypothetical protein